MVDRVKEEHPENRCAKYLEQGYYASLTGAERDTFYQCVRTGIDNPDSGMGCYAMTPADLNTFKPFFSKVIGDTTRATPSALSCTRTIGTPRAWARGACSTWRSSA